MPLIETKFELFDRGLKKTQLYFKKKINTDMLLKKINRDIILKQVSHNGSRLLN